MTRPFNTLVPELLVTDLNRSLHFYRDVLGFAIEYDRPEDGFAYLSFQNSQLMLEQDSGGDSPWRVGALQYPRGSGLNLSIKCINASELAGRLHTAGILLQKPLEDKWYRDGEMLHGERNFLVLDPDGYLLRFAEDIGTKRVSD